MREVEIKLKAPDLEKVESKLKELGCVLSEPKTQEDINFIHKDDDKWFEPEIRGFVYPRLRITNNQKHTFTVKKPVKNEMDCLEAEVQIDDPDSLKRIMEMFGYKNGVVVKKIRKTCKYKDYEITLDKVDLLGNFVEIEKVVPDESDALKIQQEMFEFAKNVLDLEKDNFTMKGYDIMMYHLSNPNA